MNADRQRRPDGHLGPGTWAPPAARTSPRSRRRSRSELTPGQPDRRRPGRRLGHLPAPRQQRRLPTDTYSLAASGAFTPRPSLTRPAPRRVDHAWPSAPGATPTSVSGRRPRRRRTARPTHADRHRRPGAVRRSAAAPRSPRSRSPSTPSSSTTTATDRTSSRTTGGTDGAGQTFDVWDLRDDPVLPLNYMKAHPNIVWFTGNSYPAPIGPYEANLRPTSTAAVGCSCPARTSWTRPPGRPPSSTTTCTSTGTAARPRTTWRPPTSPKFPVTRSRTGSERCLDLGVLTARLQDEITPIAAATTAFTDDARTTGCRSTAGYKVVFLAFPMEAYGTAAQKADLTSRVFTFFGP